MPDPQSDPDATLAHYDAVVIGGAVAGAGTALLLRRHRPGTRVLVVEREASFPRKVGEATVEVSAYFLQHALGLGEELQSQQLRKHGLRFWFSDGTVRPLARMTEVAARDLARVPTYQLDRSTLDETVLAAAEDAGCEVLRPAAVSAWEEGWPESRLTVTTEDGGERRVSARWVVDASGRRAFIARRKRLLSRVEEHPTAALWGRWSGAADLDDPTFLNHDGTALPPTGGPRRHLATNHFCGYGWWCWVIPLAGGDTSVGLVYDRRLFELPGDGSLEQRYRAFVTSRAGLAEILDGARAVADDFHAYSHLPYRTARYAARGWALVGDAAAFLDPFYSPGLDHVAMSAAATARLLADDLAGRLDGDDALDAAVERHDARFLRSYGRWLEALYLGKYEILGDAELTACAYLVDTALYYLGVVTPIYRDPASLANPTFGLDNRQSTFAWKLMRLFNRRLVRIARFRRRTGSYGRRNVGHRMFSPPPNLGWGAVPMLLRGLRHWARLEAHTLLGRLLHGRQDLERPVERVGGTAPAT